MKQTHSPFAMISLVRRTKRLAWPLIVALLALLRAGPGRSQSFPSLAVNPDATILDDNLNDTPLAAGEPCATRSDFKFNPLLPTGFLPFGYQVAPLFTAAGNPVLDTTD